MPSPPPHLPDASGAAAPARPRMVVAVGASFGGVAALRTVLGALPAAFPAAVLVVLHLYPGAPSRLAGALRGATPLPVRDAVDGEPIREGAVYLAPPDRHLRAEADATLRLSDAPPERMVRPAADVLFRSAADAFAGAVVAVVLTGRDGDGTAGAARVRARGGTVIAQDPRGAAAPGMPESSIRAGAVDLVLPLAEIAPALVRIALQGRS